MPLSSAQTSASKARGGGGGEPGGGMCGGSGGGEAGYWYSQKQLHAPSSATVSLQHLEHWPSVQSHCQLSAPPQLVPAYERLKPSGH